MTIDVYRQYFEAECTFAGVPRRAALDAKVFWDKPLRDAQWG